MNVNGRGQVDVSVENVVSLFRPTLNDSILPQDPLESLIEESRISEEVIESKPLRTTKIVNENQFPDQSMLILEDQLLALRSRLNRIKFYLGELEEIIPN
jgi:hypothetical protein